MIRSLMAWTVRVSFGPGITEERSGAAESMPLSSCDEEPTNNGLHLGSSGKTPNGFCRAPSPVFRLIRLGAESSLTLESKEEKICALPLISQWLFDQS